MFREMRILRKTRKAKPCDDLNMECRCVWSRNGYSAVGGVKRHTLEMWEDGGDWVERRKLGGILGEEGEVAGANTKGQEDA